MSASTTALRPSAQARKAARKDFTRRGQLLTRLEVANAKLGITQHKPCYMDREGLFALSLTDGRIVRGYWVAINDKLVQLVDEQDEEKNAWAQITLLSTESLAGVENFLTSLANRFGKRA